MHGGVMATSATYSISCKPGALQSETEFLLERPRHVCLYGYQLANMPVTFGSVGDIIAVALLVKDLVEALDQCRGSQAEYRQLIQELRLLEDVLRKVDTLCNASGTSGASLETVALHQTALKITDSCRTLILKFVARLAKYDEALGGDNAQKRNALKSAFAKIRWQVGEKEEVVRFRAEMAAQTTSLSVLLGATSW